MDDPEYAASKAHAHLAATQFPLRVRVRRTRSFPLVLRDVLEKPRSEIQEPLLTDAANGAQRLEACWPLARELAKRRVVEVK
jgi:hypothetical protein